MPTLTQIQPSPTQNLLLLNSLSNQPKSIVILDPTVADSQHLATGIKPDTATYILTNQPDPIAQITQILTSANLWQI